MVQEQFWFAEKKIILQSKILRKSQKHDVFVTSTVFEALRYNNPFIDFSNLKSHG